MDPRGYLRPQSPPRRQGGGHPGRYSTGLLNVEDYDRYYAYPRSSRESVSGPRSSAERIEGSARRNPPRESLPLRRKPDDYDIPPRRLEAPRRPPRLIEPVEDRLREMRPIVKSAIDRPDRPTRSRPREDESYYLTPASTQGHQRTMSASGRRPDYTQYPSRPREPPRDRFDRVYDQDRGSRQYHHVPAIRQPRDQDDKDYGYEYTDMKEQARRDLLPVPRQRTRRGSDAGPRERPSSIAGVEDVQREAVRRSTRGDGPPVTTRGWSKLEPNGNVRHEYRVREPGSRAADDDVEPIARRRSTRDSSQGPVAVHQERDGYYSNAEDASSKKNQRSRRADETERGSDSYSSRYEEVSKTKDKSERGSERRSAAAADDGRRRQRQPRDEADDYEKPTRERSDDPEREYVRRRSGAEPEREHRRQDRDEDREHRHRRKPEDEYEKRDDRDDRHKTGRHVVEGLGLGGAAAAAAGLYAKRRHDHHDSDSNASKSRGSKEDVRPIQKGSKESVDDQGDPDEEDRQRRERRRARRREREEQERQEAARGKDNDDTLSREVTLDSQSAPETRNPDDKDRRGRRQSKLPSESDDSGDEKRYVRVVSPAKEPEQKPKGILKSPRVKFPEDPAPVREGVAPLNAAGKKGIPPQARWTKIDRRLVNPEALEIGNERFEERNEYVIVLRVLSKEEIEAYANKTAEIRDTRHLEAAQHGRLALDDRAYDDDGDEGPLLQLDDHAHNEDVIIPGINDRPANAIPGINLERQAPPAMATMAPVPAAPPNSENPGGPRPDLYAQKSFTRIPPHGPNMPSYGGPAYPAAPPLQSSPQPPPGLPSGPPPSQYPPPPPPGSYALPGSTNPPNQPGQPGQPHYSPPPGAYPQQNFPPPPPPLGRDLPPPTNSYPPPPGSNVNPTQQVPIYPPPPQQQVPAVIPLSSQTSPPPGGPGQGASQPLWQA